MSKRKPSSKSTAITLTSAVANLALTPAMTQQIIEANAVAQQQTDFIDLAIHDATKLINADIAQEQSILTALQDDLTAAKSEQKALLDSLASQYSTTPPYTSLKDALTVHAIPYKEETDASLIQDDNNNTLLQIKQTLSFGAYRYSSYPYDHTTTRLLPIPTSIQTNLATQRDLSARISSITNTIAALCQKRDSFYSKKKDLLMDLKRSTIDQPQLDSAIRGILA